MVRSSTASEPHGRLLSLYQQFVPFERVLAQDLLPPISAISSLPCRYVGREIALGNPSMLRLSAVNRETMLRPTYNQTITMELSKG